MNIPPKFAQTIVEVHGEAGAAWLRELPSRLEALGREWDLELGEPFQNLSYNFVLPGTLGDGAAVVLKAGVPSDEFTREIAAMEFYGGQGAARLLSHAEGAMLLERLEPGEMLSSVEDDDAATLIAAEVMRGLWRPAPAGPFVGLREWTRGIERIREHFGGPGPFPAELLDEAERMRVQLLQSEPEAVLLHGDLHHFNILSATRAPWLAIDPKGVVGERAFEIAALLINPRPQPAKVLARRVEIVCEALDLDRVRVIGWASVFGVISAWWTFEDHGHVGTEALAFAEKMASL